MNRLLQYIPAYERDNFVNAVNYYSELLDIQPDWLVGVMWFESKLNPAAVNPVSGATGLIQFMPATAKALGTTSEALRRMTAYEQMKYVYQYLKPYTGRMNGLVDVYFAVFFPAAIGASKDTVLQTSKLSAKTIARQNVIFDANKDDAITVGEVENYILKVLGQGTKKKTLIGRLWHAFWE